MNSYSTLSQATNELKKRGYKAEFKMDGKKLLCVSNDKKYEAKDLEIVEYHRFEGMTNPGDMSIVFAVECSDGIKGTVVSSYGTYANNDLLNFMDKVKVADRTEATGMA